MVLRWLMMICVFAGLAGCEGANTPAEAESAPVAVEEENTQAPAAAADPVIEPFTVDLS